MSLHFHQLLTQVNIPLRMGALSLSLVGSEHLAMILGLLCIVPPSGHPLNSWSSVPQLESHNCG